LSKISAHYSTATTRRDLDANADHFQVYTGQVRMGTIYKTSENPAGVRIL
jgi:hypothetical protein